MSDSGEWKLTATTLASMKRVCSMAGPKDVRNKWLAEFQVQCTTEFGKMLYRLLRNTSNILDAKEDAETLKLEVKRLESTHEEFFDSIEAEPVARFDVMMEKGSQNKVIFKILAGRLSTPAVEAICKLVLETPDLNPLYLQCFFRDFLPVYLKRPYTWFSLDILVKSHKSRPQEFRNLLQILVKDPEILNTIINDFVLTLDDVGKYEYLTLIMDLEMTHRELARNLLPIHTAYKGVEKTERLQNYVCNCLIRYPSFFATDWNYGRLLLAYLQATPPNELNFMAMDQVIEVHRSPFKRPCKAALNESLERLNAERDLQNPS